MSTIAERAAALAGGRLATARRLSGGSLSEVLALTLADGRALVAKSGATARAEARMLAAMAATGAPAPDVVAVADDLLVLAAVPSEGRLDGTAWPALTDALARLHAPGADSQPPRYGWDEDHAFGRVAIVNTRTDDWVAFWAEHRLATHIPHVEAGLARRLERLAGRLGEHLPAHPPRALLHGDLWGGNVLCGAGRVTLIDPACHNGDREVDVAMLTLFDAPPERFLAALDLAQGWRARLPVYRLWPLLVHLRLFGSGYRGQVAAALDQLGV